MECSTTMRLRGYVYSNPKPVTPEKPNSAEILIMVNAGYEDPITGIKKPPVLYRCFTHSKPEVDRIFKFVKKDMFLSIEGTATRPFIYTHPDGRDFVSIKILIRTFDILVITDSQEMSVDSRVSSKHRDYTDMDNIGNY